MSKPSSARARLPRAIMDALVGHALRSPRLEVCGLIGGVGEVAVSRHPVANVARDPARRFEMDPRGQIDVFRALREENQELYAIYHSHPDGPAEPSATDLEQAAYPDAFYLIVSLAGTAAPEVRAFRLVDNAFAAVDLVVEG